MAVILQNTSVHWRITAVWFFRFLTFTTEKSHLIISYGKLCHSKNNSIDEISLLKQDVIILMQHSVWYLHIYHHIKRKVRPSMTFQLWVLWEDSEVLCLKCVLVDGSYTPQGICKQFNFSAISNHLRYSFK